jgi:hypothetical protein
MLFPGLFERYLSGLGQFAALAFATTAVTSPAWFPAPADWLAGVVAGGRPPGRDDRQVVLAVYVVGSLVAGAAFGVGVDYLTRRGMFRRGGPGFGRPIPAPATRAPRSGLGLAVSLGVIAGVAAALVGLVGGRTVLRGLEGLDAFLKQDLPPDKQQLGQVVVLGLAGLGLLVLVALGGEGFDYLTGRGRYAPGPGARPAGESDAEPPAAADPGGESAFRGP